MLRPPFLLLWMCWIGGATSINACTTKPRGGVESDPALALQAAGSSERLGTAPKPAATSALEPPVLDGRTDSAQLRVLLAQPTEYVDDRAKERARPNSIEVRVLGFNDFHGAISTSRTREGRPIGGAAVLASYLRDASVGHEGRVLIVHAGDFIGASPAESALFDDEPSVEFFNRLGNAQCDGASADAGCNLVGIVGNHEFDRGVGSLLQLVSGKKEAGMSWGVRYRGQRYPTLCANVVDARTSQRLFPAYTVKQLGGAKVGVIGAVLSGATWFLRKSGIARIRFDDEVESINRSAAALKEQGVRAIILVVHQGGNQQFGPSLARDAPAVSGEIKTLVAQLDGEIDVVVSGHSHSALSALVPNREQQPTLLTQAFHSGSAFAQIELRIEAESGEVVKKSATIVSTYGDAGPGLSPATDVAQLVQKAQQRAARITGAVLGEAVNLVSSDVNRDGECAMGDLVADAQRAALHADFAFTTPAWVRADLKPGTITWGDLFAIQPFGNRLVRVEMTGKDVLELLNQQWRVESYARILQVSGLSFSWDARKPPASRVVEVRVGKRSLDPKQLYVAAVNDFLADGGEGYSYFSKLERSRTTISDIDALATYIRSKRVIRHEPEPRIRRIDPSP
ncbi:MAG TPA: bifunctional metallophosphatase/5'-nucleotidase [Polyangiaceae bacterium]|nr:bifunctional metallophosphatase/5'-nucleotidase [Polyangiaceae bacterium]